MYHYENSEAEETEIDDKEDEVQEQVGARAQSLTARGVVIGEWREVRGRRRRRRRRRKRRRRRRRRRRSKKKKKTAEKKKTKKKKKKKKKKER